MILPSGHTAQERQRVVLMLARFRYKLTVGQVSRHQFAVVAVVVSVEGQENVFKKMFAKIVSSFRPT